MPEETSAVRIDVWLWSIRIYKTRSDATAACKGGHVRVNGNVVKPSSRTRIGDNVRVRIRGFDRILIVKGLVKKRVGAPVAQTCYEDITPERPRIYIPPVGRRETGAGRPTKKERRELDRLFGRDPNSGRKM